MKKPLLLLAASLSLAFPLLAGVEEDWQAILAFDQGPVGEFRSGNEMAKAAATHLRNQELALTTFIAKYPESKNADQAKVRLSSVLVAAGAMKASTARDAEALKLLDEVENNATASAKDKADAGFARVSLVMQRSPPVAERAKLLAMAREFARKYPSEPRIASLLTEVATVYDVEPAQKRILLNEALSLSPPESLKARIADDLKRLDMLGLPMRLRANSVDGKLVDVQTMRGRPIVVLFWAGWSQPSVKQLERLLELRGRFPAGSFSVVAISLDKNRKQVATAWKQIGSGWPIICDEKGWQSPLVRMVGINAIPTTWILDSEGVLRVLNARDDLEARLREVLAR